MKTFRQYSFYVIIASDFISLLMYYFFIYLNGTWMNERNSSQSSSGMGEGELYGIRSRLAWAKIAEEKDDQAKWDLLTEKHRRRGGDAATQPSEHLAKHYHDNLLDNDAFTESCLFAFPGIVTTGSG